MVSLFLTPSFCYNWSLATFKTLLFTNFGKKSDQIKWIDPYIISNCLQFGINLIKHGKIGLQVLHGDFAARNILVTHKNLVKICDIGSPKTVYNDPDYKRNGKAPLPIKLMAIETIRDLVFSTD